MNTFEKYKSEFDALVDATDRVIHKKPVYNQAPYIKLLVSFLNRLPRRTNFSIDREDIEQEVRLVWLLAETKYKLSRSSIQLKRYLIQMSLWHIRNWLKKEWKTTDRSVRFKDEMICGIVAPMDLGWLLEGTKYPWPLTAYERYLLYMKYIQGLSFCEIAEITQKDRRMITTEMVELISKLRSFVYEQEESSRSRNGRDGIQTDRSKGTGGNSGTPDITH